MPERIQISRERGWRMPANTVLVDRRTKWGNPCRVRMYRNYTAADAVRDYQLWIDRHPSVRSFENAYGRPPTTEQIVAALKGKNLACWCKPGDPCHADVLLRIANDDYCEACKHPARHHFENGHGVIRCRSDGDCLCSLTAAKP
jgi:hypothetical protein